MSLPASPCDIIPEQTIEVAHAAFPKGNPYLRLRDALGPLYTNSTFAALFSHTGRPAEAPAQLALMSVMQCAEGLSDAQTYPAPGHGPRRLLHSRPKSNVLEREFASDILSRDKRLLRAVFCVFFRLWVPGVVSRRCRVLT